MMKNEKVAMHRVVVSMFNVVSIGSYMRRLQFLPLCCPVVAVEVFVGNPTHMYCISSLHSCAADVHILSRDFVFVPSTCFFVQS